MKGVIIILVLVVIPFMMFCGYKIGYYSRGVKANLKEISDIFEE